jgi:hypothetical protein
VILILDTIFIIELDCFGTIQAADSKLTCDLFNDAQIITGHLAVKGKFIVNEKLQIFETSDRDPDDRGYHPGIF